MRTSSGGVLTPHYKSTCRRHARATPQNLPYTTARVAARTRVHFFRVAAWRVPSGRNMKQTRRQWQSNKGRTGPGARQRAGSMRWYTSDGDRSTRNGRGTQQVRRGQRKEEGASRSVHAASIPHKKHRCTLMCARGRDPRGPEHKCLDPRLPRFARSPAPPCSRWLLAGPPRLAPRFQARLLVATR